TRSMILSLMARAGSHSAAASRYCVAAAGQTRGGGAYMLRRTGAILAACVLMAAITPGLALAKGSKHKDKGHKGPQVCSGTSSSPGALSGVYPHGVVVKGDCQATGPTQINGHLALRRGSALFAGFGSLNPTGPVFTVKGSAVAG